MHKETEPQGIVTALAGDMRWHNTLLLTPTWTQTTLHPHMVSISSLLQLQPPLRNFFPQDALGASKIRQSSNKKTRSPPSFFLNNFFYPLAFTTQDPRPCDQRKYLLLEADAGKKRGECKDRINYRITVFPIEEIPFMVHLWGIKKEKWNEAHTEKKFIKFYRSRIVDTQVFPE